MNAKDFSRRGRRVTEWVRPRDGKLIELDVDRGVPGGPYESGQLKGEFYPANRRQRRRQPGLQGTIVDEHGLVHELFSQTRGR